MNFWLVNFFKGGDFLGYEKIILGVPAWRKGWETLI
jgi:hypothetical protein